jgi:hypothetical protein
MRWRNIIISATMLVVISIDMSPWLSAVNYPGNKWQVVPYLDDQTKSILKSLRNPEIGQHSVAPLAERLFGLPEVPGMWRPQQLSGEYFLDNTSKDTFKSLRSSDIGQPLLTTPGERSLGMPHTLDRLIRPLAPSLAPANAPTR